MRKSAINIYFFLLVSINIISTNVFGQEEVLNNYLVIAAKNNPELKSTFNQYLAALERMPQAKALPDPMVAFSIFASPVETRVGAQQAGITLSQAFPWFGQLKAQESAAAQVAQARFELFEDKKNELFFKVSAAYYDLYVLEAAIAITRENIRVLELFRELANARLESALGAAVDFLRAEMDLAELKDQLLFLEDSRLPTRTKFRELLNVKALDIQLPDTLATITLEESKNVLLDSLLVQNPGLKKLDFEKTALDYETEVAEKMGLPSFNLGLSYINIAERSGLDIADNGKDAFIFPQVGVRIPLHRKKYRSMIKEKQFLKTSTEGEKEHKTNELTTALEKTWRDYLDAERRVELYLNLINLANQALDILIEQYTSAGTDFEEMLRMERQLLRYGLELEKARADQNTSVAFVNYLTGKHFSNENIGKGER